MVATDGRVALKRADVAEKVRRAVWGGAPSVVEPTMLDENTSGQKRSARTADAQESEIIVAGNGAEILTEESES